MVIPWLYYGYTMVVLVGRIMVAFVENDHYTVKILLDTVSIKAYYLYGCSVWSTDALE